MIIDILACLLLLAFAVSGYRHGFIRQIFSILGIVSGYFGAVPLSRAFKPLLGTSPEAQAPIVDLLLISAFAIILYLITILIGRIIYKNLVKGIKPIEKTNKILGCSLAIIKSLIILYATFCFCDYTREPASQYMPALTQQYENSICMKVTHQNNIIHAFNLPEYSELSEKIKSILSPITSLTKIPGTTSPQQTNAPNAVSKNAGNPTDTNKTSETIDKSNSNNGASNNIQNDIQNKQFRTADDFLQMFPGEFSEEEKSAIQTMFKNKDFVELINDPDLRQSAMNGETSSLLSHPGVLKLITNPEFMNAAQKIQWQNHIQH